MNTHLPLCDDFNEGEIAKLKDCTPEKWGGWDADKKIDFIIDIFFEIKSLMVPTHDDNAELYYFDTETDKKEKIFKVKQDLILCEYYKRKYSIDIIALDSVEKASELENHIVYLKNNTEGNVKFGFIVMGEDVDKSRGYTHRIPIIFERCNEEESVFILDSAYNFTREFMRPPFANEAQSVKNNNVYFNATDPQNDTGSCKNFCYAILKDALRIDHPLKQHTRKPSEFKEFYNSEFNGISLGSALSKCTQRSKVFDDLRGEGCMEEHIIRSRADKAPLTLGQHIDNHKETVNVEIKSPDGAVSRLTKIEKPYHLIRKGQQNVVRMIWAIDDLFAEKKGENLLEMLEILREKQLAIIGDAHPSSALQHASNRSCIASSSNRAHG